MNQKKAKLIRKWMREYGDDWREAKYETVDTGHRRGRAYRTVLAVNCGKEIYRRLKKQSTLEVW